MHRPLFALAALAGAAGVALAARASHSGEADLAIAANFLLLHAPVLLVVSLLASNRLSLIAGYVLLLGLVLFVGDLALRSDLGQSPFPIAAPLGGSGMIIGWMLLAVSAFVGWRRD